LTAEPTFKSSLKLAKDILMLLHLEGFKFLCGMFYLDPFSLEHSTKMKVVGKYDIIDEDCWLINKVGHCTFIIWYY
jgi:hypothetical protein